MLISILLFLTPFQIYVDSAQVKPRRRLKRINFQIRRFFCLGKATSKPLQDDESGKTDKFIKVESDAAPPKVRLFIVYHYWSEMHHSIEYGSISIKL